MRDGYDEAPLNPLPPVIWLLVLPIVAMEVVLNAGTYGFTGSADAIGWRSDALQRFALSPMMLDQMLATGRVDGDYLMRFVTYPFVHGNLTHALFAGVFILALGKFVAEVYRAWAVLAVFFGGVIAGGLAYSLVPGLQVALYGAYPGAYGLIGAFTFILWARLGAEQANRGRAFTLIGFLLGIQLLFGAIFGGAPDWIADLAGFGAGFLLSFVVAPGGLAHLLKVIRQR
ncbi:rhomboid family intramembrane serine protease [Defluviimonas sp. WL0024]|uniref:Rhomboid family intramembrane serine protease n=2 Tax=Albidovulum TaxID=205889 RepID=A0ABT3J4R5_9RHOB|nr:MULTISPECIES: rhomboid family intramembrane serine protease [Defluviimonas]MCU9849211.1 rhomboid family intramembrane serine protease [Defluviimonas sp. WL0024]MCW3782663.1 rhomboid family intramembrane serine protease [Defluviimonas salinarum]